MRLAVKNLHRRRTVHPLIESPDAGETALKTYACSTRTKSWCPDHCRHGDAKPKSYPNSHDAVYCARDNAYIAVTWMRAVPLPKKVKTKKGKNAKEARA